VKVLLLPSDPQDCKFPLEVTLHPLLEGTCEFFELVKFEMFVDYFFELSSRVLIIGLLWMVCATSML
jgi:hypothetical protein